MSQSEKEKKNMEEKDQKKLDPETITDEEFEKKQKKENEIIKTALDGILTFFQL